MWLINMGRIKEIKTHSCDQTAVGQAAPPQGRPPQTPHSFPRWKSPHSSKLLIILKSHQIWTLDRFTKTFFWNFQSIQADLCYILIYKQMLEKAFCSNIAPSLSSGNHLFYKAEYMGRSCPNQVWTITFDWSALATWNKHFQTAFW